MYQKQRPQHPMSAQQQRNSSYWSTMPYYMPDGHAYTPIKMESPTVSQDPLYFGNSYQSTKPSATLSPVQPILHHTAMSWKHGLSSYCGNEATVTSLPSPELEDFQGLLPTSPYSSCSSTSHSTAHTTVNATPMAALNTAVTASTPSSTTQTAHSSPYYVDLSSPVTPVDGFDGYPYQSYIPMTWSEPTRCPSSTLHKPSCDNRAMFDPPAYPTLQDPMPYAPTLHPSESSPDYSPYLCCPTRNQRSLMVQTDASVISPSSDVRPFPCFLCTRAFARKHDLQRHIRVHTGAKPYACPSCEKAFARTDALKRHLRMEDACRLSPQVQAMKCAGKRRYKNL